MDAWEAVDAAGRVRRWEYRFGREGVANAIAVAVDHESLVLISPPSGVDGEAARAALDRIGAVTAIVAPSGFHRAGIPAAEAAYPQASIHVDPRMHGRIAGVCRDPGRVRPLAELAARLPADVEIFVPPHMKRPDSIARVATPDGAVWIFNDVVVNLDRLPRGLLLRGLVKLLGFRTGLMVNPIGGRRLLVGDRAAYTRWLCAELERRPPVALVTGHGPPIRDPAALRELAGLVARGLA